MADGFFPTLVSKSSSPNATSNPIYVQLTDGTDVSLIDGSGNVNVILASNSGTDIGDVDVLTMPGTAAESAALPAVFVVVAGDDGLDTHPLQMNAAGDLKVTLDSESVTVTATQLDIDSLNKDDDEVLVWANTVKDGTGIDYVPLVDADGHFQVDVLSGGGGTEYSEDVATPVTIVGTATMIERDDALSTLTPIEGDWVSLRSNARGALWVELDLTNDVTIADGGNTITVDAVQLDIDDLVHTTDSVSIGDGTSNIWGIDASGYGQVDLAAISVTAVPVSKDSSANSETNPIYVHNVNTITSGSEIHSYDTQAALAGSGTDNHDYTVVNTTFLLKSVIASASGAMKIEIQTGPLATLTTKAVGFVTKQGGTLTVDFDPPIEVPVTATGTVRVIRTNREGSSQDVYTTIIGNDI